MREEEGRELEGTVDATPLEGLLSSLNLSQTAYTLRIEGEIAAIFGVTSSKDGTIGGVWALTGPPAERFPIAYVKASAAGLAMLTVGFEHLITHPDARYKKAVRWAELLGFRRYEDDSLVGKIMCVSMSMSREEGVWA